MSTMDASRSEGDAPERPDEAPSPTLQQHPSGNAAAPKGAAAPADGVDIVKPANDDMSYRYLVLPNNLAVLLVSDPTADKAGAAMDVHVGSLSDPDAFPGLAHFTEHMLFYSSEKYPVEDEYTKYITDRGGTVNAYTSAEHTNYHFDVNWDSLEGALDRFAQFFICPTISEGGIEREVRAVDSEHGKNLSSDAWRKSQVNKATANPKHPYARFSTGNRDTLFVRPRASGADPRQAVVSFHQQHYCAARSKLVVLGRQGLDELEAMVRRMFEAVPDKNLPKPSFDAEVFLEDQVGVLLRVVPVREGQSLELVWQVPPSEALYKEQPLGYLSHMLGHEGEGSVFALLKAAGWASGLWAGESGGGLSFASFFTVHVELTEEGQRHIREVAQQVFRYIALLRQPGGISPELWEEVRGLAQLHFDTRDKPRPFNYTTSLAGGLQTYPPQDLLPALYGVPYEFKPEVVRQALDLLTPRRVRAFWISKAHEEGQEVAAQKAAGGGDVKAAAGEAGAVGEEQVADSEAAAEAAAVETVEKAAQGEHPLAEEPAEGVSTACDLAAEGCQEQGRGLAAEPAAAEAAAGASKGTNGGLATEPWYGTRYGVGPIPEEWLAAWEAARPEEEPRLHLPAPNPFIPTDLSLASAEAFSAPPHPVPLVQLPGRLRLWHKPDVRFGQPKAVLYLDVHCPEAYGSPRAAVCTRLFVKLMLDYLNEVAYPAQQAGLGYNLLNTQSGWQLLLSGYNHKLPLLLQEVLDRLAAFKVIPERFEFVRESVKRDYANQVHMQPYSWAMYRSELLQTVRRWPVELYAGIAAEVTAEELEAFVKRLNSRCFVEGLAAGNLRASEASRCGELLLAALRDSLGASPLHDSERADMRVVKVPSMPQRQQPVCANTQQREEGDQQQGQADQAVSCRGGWTWAEEGPSGRDENSAVIITYQVGPDDLRRAALSQLLVQLAKRDAFHELRTQQQLGYIVSMHGGHDHAVGHLALLVQSNAYDAAELSRRMDEFVDNLLNTGLPAKCGLAPAPPPPAAAENGGGEEGATAGTDKGQGQGQGQLGSAATEFDTAVEELAKTKLEKPKKLADVANRWWHELQQGSYVFDRQEAEVAQLRSIKPQELLAFARELMGGGEGCRKLTVEVRGQAEEARAKAATAQPAAASGGAAAAAAEAGTSATDRSGSGRGSAGGGGGVVRIRDMWAWKRACEAWPSVRALWQHRREAAGQPPFPGAGSGTEAEAVA